MASEIHPIKTLFVTYGGAHYRLFKILHDNFQNTSLMDMRFKQDFKKHFDHLNFNELNFIFTPSKMGIFLKARELARESHLVIANCPISGAIAYLATLFQNKKRIFIMCQDFYEYFGVSEKRLWKRLIYGGLLKLFIRLSCRNALVIALSNHIKASAIKKYGGKRVEIVPVYGINMDIFRPKKEKISFPTKNKIILTTARIAPEKGLKYLLEAFKDIGNATLVMVGPGKNKELLQLIKQYHLEEKVHIVGEVDPVEIANYYNSCDIFVLPSLKEGLGFSSGEAMACKKPVIASSTGGIPDLVIHNKTGILVEPGNSAQLRAAILSLLANPELCKQLGEQGYEHVKAHYQEQDITKRFVETLQKETYI